MPNKKITITMDEFIEASAMATEKYQNKMKIEEEYRFADMIDRCLFSKTIWEELEKTKEVKDA